MRIVLCVIIITIIIFIAATIVDPGGYKLEQMLESLPRGLIVVTVWQKFCNLVIYFFLIFAIVPSSWVNFD